eukprot:1145600-Pleurochrysis_carterae.AAC.2
MAGHGSSQGPTKGFQARLAARHFPSAELFFRAGSKHDVARVVLHRFTVELALRPIAGGSTRASCSSCRHGELSFSRAGAALWNGLLRALLVAEARSRNAEDRPPPMRVCRIVVACVVRRRSRCLTRPSDGQRGRSASERSASTKHVRSAFAHNALFMGFWFNVGPIVLKSFNLRCDLISPDKQL